MSQRGRAGGFFDLITRVLGRDEGSRGTAKERLKLVLIHDRASLSPELLEALRADMMKVITAYMDIDSAGFKVEFERQDDAVALVANIPIVSVKRHA